jgi:hypothetical protein
VGAPAAEQVIAVGAPAAEQVIAVGAPVAEQVIAVGAPPADFRCLDPGRKARSKKKTLSEQTVFACFTWSALPRIAPSRVCGAQITVAVANVGSMS